MNATSHASTPTLVKGTVARGRLPNAHYRTREYLTATEIDKLTKAGRKQIERDTRQWAETSAIMTRFLAPSED